MGSSFSVALPADPAGCHDAALTLRTAARAATSAADELADQVAMPRDSFSGIAAQTYRDAAAATEADCRGSARDLTALADALEAYADAVGAARRVLAHVRDDVVGAGLAITPDDLVVNLFTPDPRPHRHAVFDRLAAVADAAQADVASARRAWWHAVQDHTKGELPSRAG